MKHGPVTWTGFHIFSILEFSWKALEKSWKYHGILFWKVCGHPALLTHWSYIFLALTHWYESGTVFTKIIGHIGHFRWLGPNVRWEIWRILIEYIKPIGQMSDESWKFFGYTAGTEQTDLDTENVSTKNLGYKTCLNIKTVFPRNENSLLMIRRLQDRLIFNMGIPYW